MNILPSLLSALRLLIGQKFKLRDKEYQIIEILEAPLAVALEDTQPGTTIQTDIHGNARRQVSQTLTVSILDNTNLPHKEFATLLQLTATSNPDLTGTIDKINQLVKRWTNELEGG